MANNSQASLFMIVSSLCILYFVYSVLSFICYLNPVMPVGILKASHLFSPKDWLGTPVCLSLQEGDAADYKWKSLAKVYPHLLRGVQGPMAMES